MKVFISWSKDSSREIATIFSRWLPRVIQECSDPFISTETVKGDPWFATITAELENSKLGVVFITPENLDEPWLNFEAGALLTKFGKQRVCPVLVGIKKSEYSGPLKNLQLTELEDRDDAFALTAAINAACERPLKDDVLAAAFDSQWEMLEDGLESIRASAPAATKPTRSLDDKVDEVLETVRAIVRHQGLSFDVEPLTSRSAAAEANLAMARQADRRIREHDDGIDPFVLSSTASQANAALKAEIYAQWMRDKSDRPLTASGAALREYEERLKEEDQKLTDDV
jgi:hypothetical protein